MRFSGKTVLVSGGARGMGASHVRAFIAEGARVMITDVEDAAGASLAAELGAQARYRHLDVRDERHWAAVVAATATDLGPIDVLVNNAGVFALGGTLEAPPAEVRRVFEVNVMGAFLGMQAVLPSMIERRNGSIVNISSTAGLVASAGAIAYNTSKWALRGMSKCAALDVAGTGVRINSIHPGFTRTSMVAALDRSSLRQQPIPRAADPIEVTRMVLFVASDEASYSTAAEFVIDGGATAGVAGVGSAMIPSGR